MTEQEALRDLVSSEGWEYLKAYTAAELTVRSERLFNMPVDIDPVVLGWQVKSQQLLMATVRQLLTWPQRRADELDSREGRSSRQAVTDRRGAA